MHLSQPLFEDHLDADLRQIINRLLEQTDHTFLQPTERRLINDLPKFVDAELFGIYLFNEKHNPSCHLVSSNYEAFIELYEEYRHQDPLLRYLLRHGNISEGNQLLGSEGWERSELCQMMKNWQLNHSIQAPLIVDNQITGTINFARSKTQGTFSELEIHRVWALSRTLSNHLENSINNESSQQAAKFPIPNRADAADQIVVETDLQGQLFATIGADLADGVFGGSLGKSDIIDAIKSNLKRMSNSGAPTGTTTIQSPPPNAEHLVIISSVIPSDRSRFTSIIMKFTALVPQASANLETLAPRTKQVAELLLRGYSNKMISFEMGISENTVKDHLRKIYSRFGVSSRTELSWAVNSPICS